MTGGSYFGGAASTPTTPIIWCMTPTPAVNATAFKNCLRVIDIVNGARVIDIVNGARVIDIVAPPESVSDSPCQRSERHTHEHRIERYRSRWRARLTGQHWSASNPDTPGALPPHPGPSPVLVRGSVRYPLPFRASTCVNEQIQRDPG
jgi:hypothetical protein